MKNTFILLLAFILIMSCKEKNNNQDKPITQEQTQMQKNLSKYVNVKLTSDISILSENQKR